jgi:hypothetical protein
MHQPLWEIVDWKERLLGSLRRIANRDFQGKSKAAHLETVEVTGEP